MMMGPGLSGSGPVSRGLPAWRFTGKKEDEFCPFPDNSPLIFNPAMAGHNSSCQVEIYFYSFINYEERSVFKFYFNICGYNFHFKVYYFLFVGRGGHTFISSDTQPQTR